MRCVSSAEIERGLCHALTFAAASLICSTVKTPKTSSSVTALIVASAKSSTLTGGARKMSEAGMELRGLRKFPKTDRNFSAGSPTKSKGISKPSTLLFPYMKAGLSTTPANQRRIWIKVNRIWLDITTEVWLMIKIFLSEISFLLYCLLDLWTYMALNFGPYKNCKMCRKLPDLGNLERTSDSACLFPVKYEDESRNEGRL